MKYKMLFLIFVVAAIVLLAGRSINIRQVLDLLSDFPKPQILILCALSLIISLSKAWRFSVLLEKNNISIPFWRMAKVYLAGQATTPLPGGEAFRAFLLEKEIGVKPKEASAAVVVQAFLVFVSSAIVAIVGSFYYRTFINVAIITTMVLAVAFYFFITDSWIKLLVAGFTKISFLAKYAKTVTLIHNDIQESLKHNGEGRLPSIAFLKSLGIGILSNVVGGIMIFILTHSFGASMPFTKSIYLYALSVIITVVSGIVPGGIGLTEGGMTGLFVYMHIPLSKAVAIVLLYRLINLVFYILVGILFFSIFYAKDFLKDKKTKKKN